MQSDYQKVIDKVNSTKWPADAVNQKSTFAKRVKHDDYLKLMEHLKQAGKKEEHAALYLVKHTGIRPSELAELHLSSGGELYVSGAKKSEKLQRGADRCIEFTDKKIEKQCKAAIKIINDAKRWNDRSTEAIRKAVNVESRKCFPRRKAPPTMKTFRHQFGSDVKAMIKRGEISREEAAYILGHQSTDSMDKYGNVKNADSPIAIKAGADNEMENVRTPEHTQALNAAMENLTFAEIQAADGNKILAARETVKAEKADSSAEKSVEQTKQPARGFDECLDFGM